jgi:predicted alpha-1,6-mannanase (GH76 family)
MLINPPMLINLPSLINAVTRRLATWPVALALVALALLGGFAYGTTAPDRIPVPSVTIYGRIVALHVSDADNVGWASIQNGSSGDQVWLDRTWEGGRTWEGHVGDTLMPAGARAANTPRFAVDDPLTYRVGGLRACGKAGDRPETVCTSWARTTVNAATRIDAAATALMGFYDYRTGTWPSAGWWNNANALTAILDYSARTGSAVYRYAIARTYDMNRNRFLGEFRNEYIDDTGWWGLAWIRAYDLTGDQRYLQTARIGADYMFSYWDAVCGGGLWWTTGRTYKNAITNSLFIRLAAALHNRIPGDRSYLEQALRAWLWFQSSGMINSANLVNDGLDSHTCRNNGGTTWTYNQGAIVGALLELSRAASNASLVSQARRIAGATVGSPQLALNGVLTEPRESSGGTNLPSFKGAFVRNLGELDHTLPDRPYRQFLTYQTDSMWANNRTTLDQYGLHWAGPMRNVDAATQHSALDAFTAAA